MTTDTILRLASEADSSTWPEGRKTRLAYAVERLTQAQRPSQLVRWTLGVLRVLGCIDCGREHAHEWYAAPLSGFPWPDERLPDGLTSQRICLYGHNDGGVWRQCAVPKRAIAEALAGPAYESCYQEAYK